MEAVTGVEMVVENGGDLQEEEEEVDDNDNTIVEIREKLEENCLDRPGSSHRLRGSESSSSGGEEEGRGGGGPHHPRPS